MKRIYHGYGTAARGTEIHLNSFSGLFETQDQATGWAYRVLTDKHPGAEFTYKVVMNELDADLLRSGAIEAGFTPRRP